MHNSFRTIELSDPAYEHDGLRYITVKTPNLAGRGDISVWLPAPELMGTAPLPLVILLHGVYGSHWCWSLKGGAHRTAEQLVRSGKIRPMVLAMPSDGLWGDGSGYLPHNGLAFDRWIIDDVPKAVAEVLPENRRADFPSQQFIAGLSMGGFGALRLAAKYPDQFGAVHGLSSITDLNQMPLFAEEPLHEYRQPDPSDESILALMGQNRDRLPPIQFNCGTDDLLIEHNRTLHRALTEQGIPHQYTEYPGGHEWPYWQQHMTDALLFFNRCMG